MDASSLATWLERIPLWALGPLLLLTLFAAALAGWRLRRRRDSTATVETAAGGDGHEGYIVSAVLGLLALLTGFTFSLAIDRYETRRERVLVEANAIGTTYLRAQLLEEPHRARISRMLVDYTDNRIALAKAHGKDIQPRLGANDRMLADLWTATVAAYPTIRSYDFSSAFLDSMNALIDMDAARKAARYARVPMEVFLVLLIYMLISAGVLGYVLVGRNGRISAAFLLFLFSLSVLLIMDVNRPNAGGINESQEPMIALRQTMRAQPPALFDRFSRPADEAP
ncbi:MULTISPECIES: hypothetical protein [Edaphosphingomonas]|uniref:DUF4239 domain-containing protein n=2 Tax=Edaphosphingomonas TaxID=3423724 RepID=A0A2T4I6N2_9SPHN|nr:MULTISPECIES: hypothetical protein [Sphingomonas]OHT20600.1 hypothetical protein BHE75_02599 [Sphingomonas haloaromaticamans]PTD26306.1 hypothetical protein CV103_04835 [Sphingomonas fennica]